MHHTHIENIAESIGTAQSILESISAHRFSTNKLQPSLSEDMQILNEYAQGELNNAMVQLSILSNQLNQ